MIKSKFMIDKIKAELVICGTDTCIYSGKVQRSQNQDVLEVRQTVRTVTWSMLTRGTVWCRNHGDFEFENNR